MRELTEYQQSNLKADEVGRKIVKLLQDELGVGDKDLLYRKALGRVFADTAFYNPNDLSENNIGWSVDHALALHVGPIIDRALELHAWLVKNGHDDENVWDLNHADRYACFLANTENFKSLAAQTQNLTWFLAMERKPTFGLGDEQSFMWQFNLRMCVNGHFSRVAWRRSLNDLGFLKSSGTAFAHDSLRYRDCRDNGYLTTITPELIQCGPSQYGTEHSLLDWKQLCHVVYDLASLCDCMED